VSFSSFRCLFGAEIAPERFANATEDVVLYPVVHFFLFGKNGRVTSVHPRWTASKPDGVQEIEHEGQREQIMTCLWSLRRHSRLQCGEIMDSRLRWARTGTSFSSLFRTKSSLYKKKKYIAIEFIPRGVCRPATRHDPRRNSSRRAGCTFVFRRRVSHRERSRLGCCC